MRNVYVCFECAGSYLPPESMEYREVGLTASPVHCSVCQVRLAERGITATPEQVRAAQALARARGARRPGDEPRVDVRPSRPARTRRSPKPAGRRSRLA